MDFGSSVGVGTGEEAWRGRAPGTVSAGSQALCSKHAGERPGSFLAPGVKSLTGSRHRGTLPGGIFRGHFPKSGLATQVARPLRNSPGPLKAWSHLT
jgi:hypothetical protein